MIYLIAREGQMCNQLLTLAWLYTLGIKRNEKIVCPVLDSKLKNDFKFKDDEAPISLNLYESKFSRQIIFFTKVVKRMFPKLVSVRLMGKNIIFDWENFKDMDSFYESIDYVKKYFGFKQTVLDEANAIYEKEKIGCDYLIGVHIRRGDYATFNNGAWFYTDEEYCSWMKNLVDSIYEDNVGFLITSNEKVDLEFYKKKGLRVSQPGKSAVQDLCLLSLCDYIMGPPSTYSIWASIMGNKKRCILHNKEDEISLKDFEYMSVRYRDGEEFQ